MRAPQAPLENTGSNVSAFDRKRVRYQRRELLWKVSKLQSVRQCGRVPRSEDSGVTLRCSTGIAGYAGLQHCGSVWACPVCAARILVHRALEIGAVLGEAIRQGHPLGFITLTMKHSKSMPLELLWGAGAKGWRRAITGRGWVSVEPMVAGWVRVWEVTHGRNGWHVHVHCVMVMELGATAADLDAVAGGMFDRWSRGLVAAGLKAPLRKGQDWHMVTGEQAAEQLAEYLAKSVSVMDQLRVVAARESLARGMGLELTHTMPGRARDDLKTRPVWALLDDLAETGEIGAWREWEKTSKGRKQVGWSNGLRERFAPSIDEVTDLAIVEEEVGTAADDVVRWTGDQWRDFVSVPGLALELLEVAERGGAQAARDQLRSWGVAHLVLVVPSDHDDGDGGSARRASAEHPPPPSHAGGRSSPVDVLGRVD